jgi:hypothetical protein
LGYLKYEENEDNTLDKIHENEDTSVYLNCPSENKTVDNPGDEKTPSLLVCLPNYHHHWALGFVCLISAT